jgi:hypothetical protein
MKLSTGRLLARTLGGLLIFTACASIGPPQPPSLELPRPPSDLSASRKGNRVLLRWTLPALTTDRQTIRSLGPTRICRGLSPVLIQCGTTVGEVRSAKSGAFGQSSVSQSSVSRSSVSQSSVSRSSVNQSGGQKIVATYTDVLPSGLATRDPAAQATYAVEVLNSSGRGAGLSNQVHVPLAETLSPPLDFSARLTAQGVVLTWTEAAISPAAPPGVRYLYRIDRRGEDGRQILAGEVPLGNERNFTLTDPSIEWEQTYYYHAYPVTVIALSGKPEAQLEGEDTPEVKVFTHDVFPPAIPAGLQAVFSGPVQPPAIDLIWAPVTDVDLAGYNVYRREEGAAAEKLNAELVRAPAYRDTNVVSGKSYSYSVSAVDMRGNESARSEEASERVP